MAHQSNLGLSHNTAVHCSV